MIGDTENPLTEVALALSMAFFSLMVLMLFAITNSSSGLEQQTVKVDGPTSNEIRKESNFKKSFLLKISDLIYSFNYPA